MDEDGSEEGSTHHQRKHHPRRHPPRQRQGNSVKFPDHRKTRDVFQNLTEPQSVWVPGQLWDLTRQFRVNLKFEKLEGFGAQVRSGYDQRCSRERAPEARGGEKGEGSAAVGKWQIFGRERGPINVRFWTAGGGSMAWCGFLVWNAKRAGVESPRVHARAGHS